MLGKEGKGLTTDIPCFGQPPLKGDRTRERRTKTIQKADQEVWRSGNRKPERASEGLRGPGSGFWPIIVKMAEARSRKGMVWVKRGWRGKEKEGAWKACVLSSQIELLVVGTFSPTKNGRLG